MKAKLITSLAIAGVVSIATLVLQTRFIQHIII
jgi:hypothetical protein